MWPKGTGAHRALIREVDASLRRGESKRWEGEEGNRGIQGSSTFLLILTCVAAGNSETSPEDWGAIRDLFPINPFHEVILLKGRFSKQGEFFIHLNNGSY